MRFISLTILITFALFLPGGGSIDASGVDQIDIDYDRNPKFLPYYFTEQYAFNSVSEVSLSRSLQILERSDEAGQDPIVIWGKNGPAGSGEYASFLIKNLGTGEILSEEPIDITLTDFVVATQPLTGVTYAIGSGTLGDSVIVVRNVPGTDIFDTLLLVVGEDRSGDDRWTGSVQILGQSDYDLDGQVELFVYVSAGRDISPRRLACIDLDPFQIEWTREVSSVISRRNFYICPDSLEPRILFTTYGPQNSAIDEIFDDQYGYFAALGFEGGVKFVHRTLANFGAAVLSEIDTIGHEFCFYHNQPITLAQLAPTTDSSRHWISISDQWGEIKRSTPVGEMIRSIWSMPYDDSDEDYLYLLSVSGVVTIYNQALELVAESNLTSLSAYLGHLELAGHDGEVLIFGASGGIEFYSAEFDKLAVYESPNADVKPLVIRSGKAHSLVMTGSDSGEIVVVHPHSNWMLFVTIFQERQELVLTILIIMALGLVATNVLRLRATRRLRVRELMLSSLFDNMQDGFYRTDLSGSITWSSPSCARLLGYDEPPDLIDRHVSEFYVDISKRQVLAEAITKHGRVTDWSVELRRADGKLIVVSTNSSFFYDKNGKVAGIEGVFRDITKRREMERALRLSEEKYRSLVESVDAGISLIDAEGRILFTNDTAALDFGRSAEKIIGESVYDLFPAQLAEQNMDILRNVLSTREDFDGDIYTVVNGKWHWYQVHIQEYHATESESPVAMVIAHDITERKSSEVRIGLLSSAVEQSSEGLGVTDMDGVVTFANDAMAAMHGLKPEEMEGQHISKFYPVDELEKVMAAFEEVYEKGSYSGELTHLRKDGTIFPTWQTNSLLRDENQKVIGAVATIVDISGRKQMEEALRENEQKYRGIFDESVATVYIFDSEKRFIDSNQAGLDLLGYTKDELLSMSIPDVDAVPTAVIPAHKQVLSGDKLANFEHRLKRKDGRVITVLNNSRPLTDSEGVVVGIQSTLIDITDRKKAEQVLRHRVEIETLVASISTELVSLSIDEVGAAIRRILERIGGFLKADRGYISRLTESGHHMRVTHVWPADSDPEVIKQFEMVRFDHLKWWSGKLYRFECIALSNPSEIPLEAEMERGLFERYGTMSILAVPLKLHGQLIGALNFSCLETERDWPEEDIRMLRVIAEIFVNALEQKRKTEELAQVNREKLIQERQIAGGFAHEIRNALFPARGMLDKLVKSMGSVDQSANHQIYSKMVDDSLTRAIDIVGSILRYTRLGSQRVEDSVLVSNVVNDMLKANYLALDDANLTVRVNGTEGVTVVCSSQQLYMVLNNLVLNAIDAVENHPSPELTLTWRQEQRRVEIEVEDNGQGMTPEVRDRIFEAFYSTKPDRGTGLGLATVKKILALYRGKIEVESGLGKGTKFKVILEAGESQEQ